MGLRFCNHSGVPVSVCIIWHTPGCPDGGDWSKAGWWNLANGECKEALVGNLRNRYAYFHAQGQDGRHWSGPIVTAVPQRKFNWCLGVSSTDSRNRGFIQIDTGSYTDFTVNLTP